MPVNNFPFSLSPFPFKRGFTLIEFLVVLGILSVTVASTLLFLTSVLRGSNKAGVTAEVKQNGQAVLNQLEKQIRNATDAETIVSGIKLSRLDENPLYIKCFSSGASNNGWIGSLVSADGTGNYVSFTDKDDMVGGVNLDCDPSSYPNCNGFIVESSSTGASSPPVVNVCFVASQGINAPSRVDFDAQIQFQTTISLRKY